MSSKAWHKLTPISYTNRYANQFPRHSLTANLSEIDLPGVGFSVNEGSIVNEGRGLSLGNVQQGPAYQACGHEGRSIDSGLALQPPNVADDLTHIVWSDGFNFWHISEFPMMGTDPLGRSTLKGKICMMMRLIDFMNQGWPISGSICQ